MLYYYFLQTQPPGHADTFLLPLIILALGLVFFGIYSKQGIYHLAGGVVFLFFTTMINNPMLVVMFVIMGMVQLAVGFIRYRSVF